MLKRKVMIVEDEMILARNIEMKLEKMGYQPSGIADSGEEAVAILDKDPSIDLILMDIVIKGEKDGIQTAGEIQARFDIPVVYLSAYSDENTFKRAEISNPFGYILKPVGDRELSIALEIALYKHDFLKKIEREKDYVFSILDSIDEGIIALDENRKIRYINAQASYITGWRSDEAAGMELEEVADMQSIRQAGEAFLICKKKERIAVEYKTASLFNKKGEKTGSVVFFNIKSPRA